MNSKISSLKEKMMQALTSTMKVISEDFKIKNEKLTLRKKSEISEEITDRVIKQLN